MDQAAVASGSFQWIHLLWAVFLGGLSAASLPLGSVFGLAVRPRPAVSGLMAAFGAGALIAALTIELVAPTVAGLTGGASPHGQKNTLDFAALIAGSLLGGILFIFLDQAVNSKGGFLRKYATIASYLSKRKKQENLETLKELSKVGLLRSVPIELIQQLVDCVRPAGFEDSQVLFEEGDRGDILFFIRSGEIQLFQHGRPFKRLSSGDVLGEIALLTGSKRTAKAASLGKTSALVLRKEDFDHLRSVSPELNEACLKLARERIEELESLQRESPETATEWVHQASEALRAGPYHPSDLEIRKAGQEHGTAALAIWLGILLDGIPESFVIGTGFLSLLALKTGAGAEPGFLEVIPYTLIAGLFLSNFPEAMSSSSGMRLQGMRPGRILLLWGSLTLLTAIGAGIGYAVGESLPPSAVILIEGTAAGAMLVMISSTMLPEAVHLGGAGVTGMSTLVGFLSAVAFKILE